MSPAEPTPRFQLLINDEMHATASIGNVGVLSAIVNWLRPDPLRTARFRTVEDTLSVHLGGLDSANREFLDWSRVDLQIGDQVTVRLLPAGESDPPVEKRQMGDRAPRPKVRGRLHSRPEGSSREKCRRPPPGGSHRRLRSR